MPSEEAITELDGVQAELNLLSSKASQRCEWALDWYASPPDIPKLRQWIQLLDADSRRLERFSRREESAQRIAAMFHLARTVALIPRLDMQREAAKFGAQSAERAAQFFTLSRSANSAQLICAAADALAATQAESLVKCPATERVRWISRTRDRVAAGASGASLYEAASGEEARIIVKSQEYPLSRLSGESLQVELRAGEPYFEEVEAAWMRPDATALLGALSKRADKGDFGAWMAAARPDFAGVRGDLIRAKAQLDSLRDTARTLSAGQPGT